MKANNLQIINKVLAKSVLSEDDLQKSLLVLKSNQSSSSLDSKDRDIKMFESIKINHLYLHSKLLINGISELQFFWGLMFDWSIQPNIKANLEQSFTKSLVQWKQDYHRIFEQGLEKSIDLLKRRVQFQCNQRTVQSANLQLSNSEYQYSISMNYDQNNKNIFKTIQFIANCCLNTLKFSASDLYYLKYITKLTLKITNIGMSILSPNQIQISIIQTLNTIIDACLQTKLSHQQKMRCIEEISNTTDLQNLMLIAYNIGTECITSNDRGSSWIVLKLHNTESQQQYLRNKIDLAQVHLKYIHLFDDSCHYNINFICNEPLFLKNLLYTIHSFTTVTKNYQHYELKDQFISYLLQIYFNYLLKNPSKLHKMQYAIVKNIIIPLFIVKAHYLQHILMKDPSKILNILQEITMQKPQSTTTIAPAAKLLRVITNNKQMKDKLVQQIMLKLQNSNNKSDLFDQTQINYETIWLIVLTITPKLRQQERSIKHILSMLSNNKQLFVSNIGLCIILFFMQNLEAQNQQYAENITNILLRQILQRQSPQSITFLLQLHQEKRGNSISPYLLRKTCRLLLEQKATANMNICWRIFNRCISHYIQQLQQTQLIKIVHQLILPQLNLIHQSRLQRVNVFNLYSSIKTISNLLLCCSDGQIPIIQPCFIKLSFLFEKITYYGFQQQLLQTVILYFTKIHKLKAQHKPFIALITQQFYKKSFESKQLNPVYLSFCKTIIKMQSEQDSFDHLLLISSTIIQNAKYYNIDSSSIECQNTEQQIHKSLLLLQEIIHILAEAIPKHHIEQICRILGKQNKVYCKKLHLRMANVVISCRIYCIPHSFCWHEVENMVIECEIQIEEIQRLIRNLQNLLEKTKPIRSPKDYAFILNILYIIVQKYQFKLAKNRRVSSDKKMLQFLKAKTYQIFVTIFKRKRLVFDQIRQSFTHKSSSYFQQLQRRLQNQSNKSYPLEYLSMIF